MTLLGQWAPAELVAVVLEAEKPQTLWMEPQTPVVVVVELGA